MEILQNYHTLANARSVIPYKVPAQTLKVPSSSLTFFHIAPLGSL